MIIFYSGGGAINGLPEVLIGRECSIMLSYYYNNKKGRPDKRFARILAFRGDNLPKVSIQPKDHPMFSMNREELLKTLNAVQPGLSPREVVEQSSCFIFKDGHVYTYNDEISCHCSSGLPDTFIGAVSAGPLLNILNKLTEDTVSIQQEGGEFVVSGKGRASGIRMEQEILLALPEEAPEEWKQLPEGFNDAIDMVTPCASRDQSLFMLTCVRIHPKWVEACDNYQMARYRISMDIETPILVRSGSIQQITPLGMTEFGVTQGWISFRSKSSGLLFSCRLFEDDFPKISKYFKTEGAPITLPRGLDDALGRAEIFSKDNTDNDLVTVDMSPGKLVVTGRGSSGWYIERKKLPSYTGPAISFLISPKMLSEISKKHTDCQISESRLKVSGERLTYIACLGQVAEAEAKVEEAASEE